MSRKTNRAADAIATINRQMGSSVLTMATDKKYKIERVPIGILTLERLTGGGFVRGRHVELFGNFGAGKSFTAYKTMALAQQRGELCGMVDAEHVFDDAWFRKMGGDPDSLAIFTPSNAEEAIKVLMLFAQNEDNFSVVTVDSVASLLPREELQKDLAEGDDRIAALARLMSRALRRVTTVNRDTVFIWTNQTREKIGSYIPTQTTPGGRALGFYATTRIEMVKAAKIKEKRKVAVKGKMVEKEIPVGHWIQVRSDKEKSAMPYRIGMFAFDTENGRVDIASEIIQLGLEDSLIERRADTFYYTMDSGEEITGSYKRLSTIIHEREDLRTEMVEIITENSILMAGG